MQNDKFGPPLQVYPAQTYPPQTYPQQPVQPINPPYNPAYPQYPPSHQGGNHAPGPYNPGVGQPPDMGYNRPPIQHVPQTSGCFSRNQRNKPQSNSLACGCMIFFSGGMNIASCIQLWNIYAIFLTTHMRLSWFIGAIIGSIIAALVVKLLPKKIILQAGSIFVLVGGIILAATRRNSEAIIAARYLDGIGNGLVFAPILSLAGEIVVKDMRGMVASSTEAMSFAFGICLQMIYSSSWSMYSSFTADQLQGVLSSIYGVMALITCTFCLIESPVASLIKGQEQEAIEILRRLQRPSVITTETYQILEQHKHYVAENNTLSNEQSVLNGLPALLRLCFFRALNAMNFSVVLSIVFLNVSISSSGISYWQFIVYGALRFVGSIVGVFLLDSLGRKKITMGGFLICSGLSLAVGVVCDSYSMQVQSVLTALLFFHTFFGGLVATASSAYLTEAFPLSVKPYFITVSFIIEMLVHIIICSVGISELGPGISSYFFVLAAFSFVYFAMSFYNMPETKRTTLIEAQEKFRTFVSKGF